MPQNFWSTSVLRGLLVGEDGRIRIGWRLLAYTVAYLACVVTTGLLGHLSRTMLPRWARGVLGAVFVVSALVAAFRVVRRRIDRRPWDWLGLPGRGGGLGLLGGFVGGFLMMAVVLGAEWGCGWVEIRWTATLAGLSAMLGGLVSYLGVGLSEELFFRGAVLQNLSERLPLWVSTLLTGIAFGLFHLMNPEQHVDAAFLAACILGTGLLTVARLVTGSLMWAIGWHAAWDWAQDLLGLGEPGAVRDFSLISVSQHGPPLWVGRAPSLEGGLLEMAVVAVAAAAFWGWGRARGMRLAWGLPMVSGEAVLVPSGRTEVAAPTRLS